MVCAGRMTPEDGAAAVQAGEIDGVGVARQFLTDPAWVTKLMEDREEDIKPLYLLPQRLLHHGPL